MDPDTFEDFIQDPQNQLAEIHHELAEWNDNWASANEDGWFYGDDD
ncbi:MAG: hypothetical protein Q7R22_017590 [Verrucomicrobiota bacterium JB025]|nr:hypothetical protein [Verrucomicrobiota bacterium JB025]